MNSYCKACLAVLAFNVVVGSRAVADETDYYIWDGSKLQTVRHSDSRQLVAKEWQIWLFLRDKPRTNPGDVWGRIAAASPSQATQKLADDQEIVRNWMRASHRETDGEFTHFNTLGPIAVVRNAKTLPEKAGEALHRISLGLGFVARVLQGPGGGTNGALRSAINEYSDRLKDAEKKLKDLQPLLLDLNERQMASIDTALATIERDLNDADKQQKKIEDRLPEARSSKSVGKDGYRVMRDGKLAFETTGDRAKIIFRTHFDEYFKTETWTTHASKANSVTIWEPDEQGEVTMAVYFANPADYTSENEDSTGKKYPGSTHREESCTLTFQTIQDAERFLGDIGFDRGKITRARRPK